MKNCPFCQSANVLEHKFCEKCGKPLDLTPISPPPDGAGAESTVRWTGQALAAVRDQTRRPIALDTLFAKKNRVLIGRAPDCDVCLSHPMVSRYHAMLERTPMGLRLRDLSSVNGISVGGDRVLEAWLAGEGERFGIGPFLFTIKSGVLHTLDNSRSLRLVARHLEKVVSTTEGKLRKLLDDINLVVEPGEFVTLLGPSGSGKSTLMDCLNGRRRATGGQVLANGEDFYRHFDNFRQSLGYVPQKDIVHGQLTVYRALYYTARLRLPTDTDPAELTGRIEEVLGEMELEPHRNTLVANLSGGQVKRVSLGAELLARPCLLYIDEATSGLDAGTESRMMRLFRGLANEGKSIVCITHNVDNVDRCHLALVLARGRLVYYGPPKEAPAYFGVDRLGEIYDKLSERALEHWEKQFASSAFYQEFVEKRLAALSDVPAPKPRLTQPAVPGMPTRSLLDKLAHSSGIVALSQQPAMAQRFQMLTSRYLLLREFLRPISDLWHQFRVLTARYVELTLADRRSLRLFWLQAPIVAIFILLGFTNKPYTERLKVLPSRNLNEDERGAVESLQSVLVNLGEDGADLAADIGKLMQVEGRLNPRFTYMLLYILTITILWFGCNNAAKEIVKEEAIYARERAVNLGILPYLASKFLVLSVLSAAQAGLLMFAVYGVLALLHETLGQSLPPPDYMLAYLPQFGVMTLLAMTGVALGLLLSACVSTPERANALLPYVLIPQIILGGGLLPIRSGSGALHILAFTLSPVYWAFRAVRRGATTLPEELPYHMNYDDSVGLACAALTVQMVVLILATAWFLRRKDVR
jgi:ABC-type multidrug transport system ATPase subunit